MNEIKKSTSSIKIIIVFALLITSCAEQPSNKLEKLLRITGNEFSGSCKVGDVRGDAKIIINGNILMVTYSAMGYSATEIGELQNLEIKNDGEYNTYRIVGDWINQDAGDGHFHIELFGPEKPNTIYIAIDGSSWKYYDNIRLSDEDLKKYMALMSVVNDKGGRSTVNASGQSSEAEPAINKMLNDTKIRFDGYYRFENDDIIRLMRYFPENRNYPENRVVVINGTREMEAYMTEFLKRETMGDPAMGLHNVPVTVKGDSLLFTVYPEKGDIDFRGKVINSSSLRFERYSHFNGHRDVMEYIFKPDFTE